MHAAVIATSKPLKAVNFIYYINFTKTLCTYKKSCNRSWHLNKIIKHCSLINTQTMALATEQ